MFRHMPFFLLGVILLSVVTAPWLSYEVQSVLYGVSLSIKSWILFILPTVIFSLLFKTAVNFSKQASFLIILVVIAVCISNFLSTLISYGVGNLTYYFDIQLNLPQGNEDQLTPAFLLSLPNWISNSVAMMSALFLGVFLSRWKLELAMKISRICEKVVQLALKSILGTLPFFIFGFILKMNYEGALKTIVQDYALIFILVATATFAYLVFLYSVVSFFNPRETFVKLKNMLPAVLTGFGTMSSAAAMPLTILATEKNSKEPGLTKAIIPMTVNIHLIGDCFAIPIFAFAVMKSFGFEEPVLSTYLGFAVYFVIAKFSVAAVPGGGILVMLPILESQLGFNAEMLSLMTALYLLFDPVITSANILGNGGFALCFEKLACLLTSKRYSLPK